MKYTSPIKNILKKCFCLFVFVAVLGGLPRWLGGKEFTFQAGDVGSALGWEDPLEKEMVIHSSILAWEIPRTEKPAGYVHGV